MNCHEAREILESVELNGSLSGLRGDCRAHIRDCSSCWEVAMDRCVADMLKSQNQIQAPVSLEDRIIRNALASSGQTLSRFNRVPFLAVAASIVLAIAVSLTFVLKAPAPSVSNITLAVNVDKPVRFVLSSDDALTDAQLRVAVSDNISLTGFEGMREVSWKTNIKQGKNLLVLPVHLLQPTDGKIELKLEHEGSSKAYIINVTPSPEESSAGAVSI